MPPSKRQKRAGPTDPSPLQHVNGQSPAPTTMTTAFELPYDFSSRTPGPSQHTNGAGEQHQHEPDVSDEEDANDSGSADEDDDHDDDDDTTSTSAINENETSSRLVGRSSLSPPPSVLPSIALPSRINLASRVQPRQAKVQQSLRSQLSSSVNPSTTSTTPTPLAVPSAPSTSTFTDLGISPALIASMGAMSIRKPTPIQAGCVPAILAGRDCIGIAQTGSGKTLAFALPILQRISRDPFGVWAVVLTPTRSDPFPTLYGIGPKDRQL